MVNQRPKILFKILVKTSEPLAFPYTVFDPGLHVDFPPSHEEREVDDGWFDLGVARRAAGDLVHAWQEAKEHCAVAFPPASEEAWGDRVEEWPGKWLKDTHGRLGDLILMPTRDARST